MMRAWGPAVRQGMKRATSEYCSCDDSEIEEDSHRCYPSVMASSIE